MSAPSADAVLFDLDGTVLDTAPEFITVIQRMRLEEGLAPADATSIRAVVSQGGAAMLRAGFPGWDGGDRTLLDQFLVRYRETIGEETLFFPGVRDVLNRLDEAGKPWAIVTNKPTWLTVPLLAHAAIGLAPRVLVCGDTLERRKPHPDPVLHACSLLGSDPARTLMVGDDSRDVESAQAAGAVPVVVDWGYSDPGAHAWGAMHRVADAGALLDLIGLRIRP